MAKYAPYIFLGCVLCSGSSLFTYLVVNDKKTDPGPAPNTTDISKPGDTCVPTGTPDPKGTYITNSKGNCDLSRCSVGYSPIDGTCVKEDPTPSPAPAPAPKKAPTPAPKKAPAPAPKKAPAPAPVSAPAPEKITTLPTISFEAALLGPNGKYARVEKQSKKIRFMDTKLDKKYNTFIFTPLGSSYKLSRPTKKGITCGRWMWSAGSFGCGKDYGYPFNLEKRPGDKFAIKYGNSYITSRANGLSYSNKFLTPGDNTDFTLIKIN